MKAVGEMLREERKRQGMSIDDVMSRTKVSRRHIEALEDGNITDLPHSVYVKGFLKVYAELLGLEYTQLLPAVDDAYASLGLDPMENEPHARPSENISLSPPQRSGRFSRWILILLLLSLLGGGGYYAYEYFFGSSSTSPSEPAVEKQESSVAPQTAPGTGSVTTVVEETITEVEEPITPPESSYQGTLDSAQEQGAASLQGNSPDDSQLNASENASENASGAQPAEQQDDPLANTDEAVVSDLAESVVQGADNLTETAVNAPGADPASPNIVIIPETARQAPSSKIKVLQVIAKGQCWIEAKVDAELTTDFYVRKGERVDIKFQENLAVKFGNIGEVTLRYNGKNYTTAVPANGVKTLVFPPPSS